MSVKEERISDADEEVYSERTIKREPMFTECEDQCSYSLIKVEKDSEDDTETVSILVGDDYIKQEELEEQTTVLNAEQIVVKQESSDTDVPVKVEIEIGPTVIQPQYIGSSLHTTDASKAELIQCGGADVALGTTTPGAASYWDHSTGSRSVVPSCTTGQTKKDTGILSLLLKEKSFACGICKYKCKDNLNLVTHMRTHTGKKLFSCNICVYKCTTKSSLVSHVRTHTREKLYSCNICEYKCADKSKLVLHKRTHTREKPYSCNICEYKCVRKLRLVEHIRTHTGEKPYSCNICEYKCADKSSLGKHMRTHTGEKPYSCNICEFKCADNSTLRRHFTHTHTEEKPYSCNVCEYKCVEKSSLGRHIRIHTGEKPYSCNICEYKCADKSTLQRHMRTHTLQNKKKPKKILQP